MSHPKTAGERGDRDGLGSRARLLLLVNAGARVAYGTGGLLSPAAMERLGMAADTPERPEARLFVRAFGGHMIGVGAFGLMALHRRRNERPAAAVALAIDLADIVSALVESAKRGRLDSDLSGGIVFSASGAITAALALRWPGRMPMRARRPSGRSSSGSGA
jgi:plasmid stabilization system protein ParE